MKKSYLFLLLLSVTTTAKGAQSGSLDDLDNIKNLQPPSLSIIPEASSSAENSKNDLENNRMIYYSITDFQKNEDYHFNQAKQKIGAIPPSSKLSELLQKEKYDQTENHMLRKE